MCLGDVPPPEDSYSIRLRRSKVFGTGGHPATRAAALALITNDLEPDLRVIDFKCGTGLLGIISAKFGCDVYHMDDSLECVEEAIHNGIMNLVPVQPKHKDQATKLNDSSVKPADLLVTHQGSYEMVKKEVGKMHELLKGGGTLILSGHTARDHRAVKNILSEFFEIEGVDEIENWAVITARK